MKAVEEAYINKLKNKLFGCLCEREGGRDWEPFLDSILIELMGWEEKDKTIDYYIIFYKLSSCRYLSFTYFRKTIFDVMNLLGRNIRD